MKVSKDSVVMIISNSQYTTQVYRSYHITSHPVAALLLCCTYIFGGAAEGCCPCGVVADPLLGQSKVRQTNVTVLVQQYVLRFKIPVIK